jgi:TolA-binding protein
LYEKRYVFNSVVAYILFSVLIFAGLYLAFQAQVSREREAVMSAQVRIDDLQSRASELEAELERRREAEEEAYGLYRLLEESKEEEIIERFPTIRGKLVNRAEVELMQREVDRINTKLAKIAFENGAKFFKRRQYKDARDSFLKSQLHVEKSHYAPELTYKLGMTLFNLKDLDGSAMHLRKTLTFDHKKDTLNEITYHLAVALDRLGRAGEARTVYEDYADRFKYDERALEAQKRVMQLNRDGVGPARGAPN